MHKWFFLSLVFGLSACSSSQVLRPVPMPMVYIELATDEASSPEAKNIDLARLKQQQQIDALCNELGQRLGSVSTQACLNHTLSHSGYYSRANRALAYKDYLKASAEAKRVLVVGGIHGDEYSSFSLLFRFMERLDDSVDMKHVWRLIPAANPDGLLDYRPAQRMNGHGVDLNRNFATSDWGAKAHDYWRHRTGSDQRRYPGKEAHSEPESRWISHVIQEWKPDVIVSVHAPYGILDFDAAPDNRTYPPKKIGFLDLKLLGTYPGSLGRYAAKDYNIPVLTLELPHAGIMPSQQEQAELWDDLLAWLDK